MPCGTEACSLDLHACCPRTRRRDFHPHPDRSGLRKGQLVGEVIDDLDLGHHWTVPDDYWNSEPDSYLV
jgi:hypothetical protein